MNDVELLEYCASRELHSDKFLTIAKLLAGYENWRLMSTDNVKKSQP